MKTTEVTLQVKAITFDVKGLSPILAVSDKGQTWEETSDYKQSVYGIQDVHTATLLADSCLDSRTAGFFLVYSEDCFSPPLAVVHANNLGDAIDIACDECSWLRIEPETDKEKEDCDKWLDKGVYNVSSNGYVYDCERLVVKTAKPVAVHF